MTTIEEYRLKKHEVEELAAVAREAMQSRFTELLLESAGLFAEYQTHFGDTLSVPECISAFDVRSEKSKTEAIGPKVGGLRRSLKAAIKRADQPRIDAITAQLEALGVAVTPEGTE